MGLLQKDCIFLFIAGPGKQVVTSDRIDVALNGRSRGDMIDIFHLTESRQTLGPVIIAGSHRGLAQGFEREFSLQAKAASVTDPMTKAPDPEQAVQVLPESSQKPALRAEGIASEANTAGTADGTMVAAVTALPSKAAPLVATSMPLTAVESEAEIIDQAGIPTPAPQPNDKVKPPYQDRNPDSIEWPDLTQNDDQPAQIVEADPGMALPLVLPHQVHVAIDQAGIPTPAPQPNDKVKPPYQDRNPDSIEWSDLTQNDDQPAQIVEADPGMALPLVLPHQVHVAKNEANLMDGPRGFSATHLPQVSEVSFLLDRTQLGRRARDAVAPDPKLTSNEAAIGLAPQVQGDGPVWPAEALGQPLQLDLDGNPISAKPQAPMTRTSPVTEVSFHPDDTRRTDPPVDAVALAQPGETLTSVAARIENLKPKPEEMVGGSMAETLPDSQALPETNVGPIAHFPRDPASRKETLEPPAFSVDQGRSQPVVERVERAPFAIRLPAFSDASIERGAPLTNTDHLDLSAANGAMAIFGQVPTALVYPVSRHSAYALRLADQTRNQNVPQTPDTVRKPDAPDEIPKTNAALPFIIAPAQNAIVPFAAAVVMPDDARPHKIEGATRQELSTPLAGQSAALPMPLQRHPGDPVAIAPVMDPVRNEAEDLIPLDGLLSPETSDKTSAVVSPRETAPIARISPEVLSRQVAHLVVAHAEDRAELLLDPIELGRLRFEISHRGDGVQILITAERPETMDLLRRNADQLLADLQALGFSGSELGFGSWGGDPKEDAAPQWDQSQPEAAAPQAGPQYFQSSAPPRVAAGGLDMRL
jgi:hypothetical protein